VRVKVSHRREEDTGVRHGVREAEGVSGVREAEGGVREAEGQAKN
jgi:hypothetical protein